MTITKNRKARLITAILCFIIMAGFMIVPATASAEQGVNQHVYDKAKLLSTSEAEELETMCIEYGEDAGIEIIILTHDDPSAKYAEDYIEDFEDTLPVGDRVYILVDMANRDVFMEGYGTAETYIHSKRIGKIIEEIKPYLSDGEYYDAFQIYIERSAAYMKDDSELNYDHDYSVHAPQNNDPSGDYYDETFPDHYQNNYSGTRGNTADRLLSHLGIKAIVSLVVGGIVVAIMAYNSGGTMTAGGDTYRDSSHSGLIGRRDDYLRTTVTRVRKPTNNNKSSHGGGFNSGGYRGGVSSGGRSHSSGGGKF